MKKTIVELTLWVLLDAPKSTEFIQSVSSCEHNEFRWAALRLHLSPHTSNYDTTVRLNETRVCFEYRHRSTLTNCRRVIINAFPRGLNHFAKLTAAASGFTAASRLCAPTDASRAWLRLLLLYKITYIENIFIVTVAVVVDALRADMTSIFLAK